MNLDYRMSKEQAKQQIQLFRTLYDDVKIEKAEQGKKDPFFQEVLEKKDQATRLEYAGEKILELTLRYAEIDGEVCLIEMIRRLDTEQMKNKESWQKESEERSALYDALYIDALTGAYNRRYYEDKLRKKELEAGVAMMDLDDFKPVSYTHLDVYKRQVQSQWWRVDRQASDSYECDRTGYG